MSRPTLPDPADDALIAAHYRKDQPMTLQTHHRARGTRPEPLFQRMARLRMERGEDCAPALPSDAAAQARREAIDAYAETRVKLRRRHDRKVGLARVGLAVMVMLAGWLALAMVRFW